MVAKLEDRVAFLVETYPLPESVGDASVDLIGNVDQRREGNAHVGADRLPSVTATARAGFGVAEHGHDGAIAHVLDGRLERGPAAPISLVAERAKAAGISAVAFDRSGFKYHGRVKALADAARESGLEF